MQVSLYTLENNHQNSLGLQSFLTDVNFRSHKTRIALRGNNKPHIDWRSFWVPVSMITTPFSNSSSPNFCASAWQIPKTSKLPVKALSYCSLVRISGKLSQENNHEGQYTNNWKIPTSRRGSWVTPSFTPSSVSFIRSCSLFWTNRNFARSSRILET